MRRRFKVLAVLIGVPALLLVLAAVIVTLLVDSNRYKGDVIALVKTHTGYDLHIDGSMQLHLFPRLRVTASDLRLASPPGFENADLARLPWLAVNLKPWALLIGRIEADAIDVVGLRVNLERDRAGRSNWQATSAPAGAGGNRQAPDDAASLAALAAAELDVRDASLVWHDQANDERILVTSIRLHTGALRDGGAIDDIRVQATVADSKLRVDARGDATLSASGDALVIPALTATFANLGIAGMQVNGTLSTRLTAALPAQRLNLDALRVSARMTDGEDRHASVEMTTGVEFDLAEQRFAASTVSVKVPRFSVSGHEGQLTLLGVLSGDVAGGRYTLQRMRGDGTLTGTSLNASGVAFALSGSLNADLEQATLLAPRLEVAGSIDGDELPFRLRADLALAHRARTLTASNMDLSVRDWHAAGEVTLRAAASPRGVQGVLDLRIREQWVAGSFAASESATIDNGIDVHADVMADLDLQGSGYSLRGRNAVALRTTLSPAADGWRVGGLLIDARLADPSFANGAIDVALRGDLLVDLNNAGLRSDNLRATVDNSHVAGSVNVRGVNDPAVRIDLEVDAIDADRYLLSGSGAAPQVMPVGVSIDAIRALDLVGEVRIGKLTLNGVHMHDVRLTAGSGAGGG